MENLTDFIGRWLDSSAKWLHRRAPGLAMAGLFR